MNQDHKSRNAPIASPEAEQSVLGAILIQPQVLAEIATIVSPDSFYWESHNLIFRVMLDLQERGEPVDLTTVTALLRERSQLERIGGPVFLAQLSEQVGFAVNAGYYARLVRDSATIRELVRRTRAIFEKCQSNNGHKVSDLILYAESQIFDLSNEYDLGGPPVISAQELLNKDFSDIFKNPVIGGGILLEGCSLLLAGESGEGKSMLRLELALYLALGNRELWGLLQIGRARRVLIIQFENIEALEQLRLRRMLKGLGLSHPPENLMFSSPLGRFNLGEKVDQAWLMTVIRQYRPEVLVLDPLSSLHVEPENDNARMRAIMDNLTQINRRAGTSVILVHHYGKPNKDGAGDQYRTRGASSIRDWADTILGLSRKDSLELVLKSLDFLKVRCGPEPKPIILERD